MSKLWGNTFRKALPLLLVLLITASGCGGSKAETNIINLAMSTQINTDNSPVNERNVFLSSTPVLYFSAVVVGATSDTKIEVKWLNATKNQVLATETFRGGRTAERPQEFLVGTKPVNSYFSSRLNLVGISWPLNTYEVQVALDGKEVGKINFNVVADKDFDVINKQSYLKNLYLGSAINKDKQVTIPGTTFERSQEKIYAVALFQDMPANTDVLAVWKSLSDSRNIDSFYTKFSGSGYLPFEISLEKFGRLWSDGLWPKGIFEFSLYVDNVLVITKNFAIS